jgi:hypothetical protein
VDRLAVCSLEEEAREYQEVRLQEVVGEEHPILEAEAVVVQT